uniref:Uncharacterized protein n=1 Tax=Meloidogyne enterolobii TaxID=390850 RepID=A0A6V7THD9_MELEN|nr:unnamed protein product [Meloidogyne enterolobii]
MTAENFDEKMSEFIKLRITFDPTEVKNFVEIIFKYLNKLMGNQELDKIKFYAEKLLKINWIALNRLYTKLSKASVQIGIYLSKILKDKIAMDCNNWINSAEKIEGNNENNEKIIAVKRFCKIGMLICLGKFFSDHLIEFKKKSIIENEKMIKDSMEIGFNAALIKEKKENTKAKITKLEGNILNYENYYFPIWNKAKDIIIGNEIIENKNEVVEVYSNLQDEIKTQIEQLSFQKFNYVFESIYAIKK